MNEEINSLTETTWGLDVVLKENAIIDNGNAIPIIKHIILNCKEFGKRIILIEGSITSPKTSVIKILEIAQTMQKEFAGGRIAFVTPNHAENGDTKFMETAAMNRSVLIRYFTDRDTALEWLLK